jgi:hypothetical protein
MTAGPRGRKGHVGANGTIGATGAIGGIGARGETGRIGATGRVGGIGATGQTGGIGATGPRGPSDAYNAESGGGTPIALGDSTGFVTVQSVSVAAGSYLFLAKFQLLNNSGGAGYVMCEFPGELDENSAVVPASGTFGAGVAEITLQHADTFASATTVLVQCEAFGANVVTSFDKLTAVQVSTIH